MRTVSNMNRTEIAATFFTIVFIFMLGRQYIHRVTMSLDLLALDAAELQDLLGHGKIKTVTL